MEAEHIESVPPPPPYPCRFKEVNSHCNHGEELKDNMFSHISSLGSCFYLFSVRLGNCLVTAIKQFLIFMDLWVQLFISVSAMCLLFGCSPGGASGLVLPQPSCRTQCSEAFPPKVNLLHETLSKRDCNKDSMCD